MNDFYASVATYLKDLAMTEQVFPHSRLIDDLCIVSSDYILLRQWLRDSYGVELKVEELIDVTTVDALCALVRTQVTVNPIESQEVSP